MTITRHNGKTTFQIFTVGYIDQVVTDDLDELCKMVDARDEIIGNANAEMLKREYHIVKLEQKCDSMDGVIKTVSECGDLYKVWWHDERGKNTRLSEKLSVSEEHYAMAKKEMESANASCIEVCEQRDTLLEELKCVKLAKDKTDAENTRLWALDKNEMHRKYEELIGRHNALDDHCQLTLSTLNHTNEQFKEYRTQYNDTENAYRACSHENFELNARCAELQTLCDNQSKRLAEMLEMLGGKEYTVTFHGDCIRYTVV